MVSEFASQIAQVRGVEGLWAAAALRMLAGRDKFSFFTSEIFVDQHHSGCFDNCMWIHVIRPPSSSFIRETHSTHIQ